MFWIILFAIVLIGGIIFAIYSRDSLVVLLTLFVLLAIILVGVLTSECIQATVVESGTVEYKSVSVGNIYAINDTVGIEADGYLFSTHVDSTLKYNYVIETPMGFEVKNVSANSCFIKHSDSTPQIEEFEVTPTNKVAKFFSFPWTKYVITVPEGTVSEEFDVNLE